MESNSILGEFFANEYKNKKFIDNLYRNKPVFPTYRITGRLKSQNKKDSVEISKYCTDGKDDGKISTKEKIGNFAKGIISPVTNMFKSTKNFIKGLGAIALGAGLIYITGGAAAPVMVAAGVLGGGIQIGKNALKAKNAKTDKDAKQAWQGMGTGTTTVAVSVAGAKSALKASGTEAAAVSKMNPIKATIECFKKTGGYGKSLLTGLKGKLALAGAKSKPDTTVSTEEVPVGKTKITEKTTEASVPADEPIVVETPDEPIVTKTSNETLSELKTAVEKQSETVKNAGSELDEFTQELLNSTINRTKNIENLYGRAGNFPQSEHKGLNIHNPFRKK